MRLRKVSFVLLALLLAAIAMVPIVSADDLHKKSADKENFPPLLIIDQKTTIIASGFNASNTESQKTIDRYQELNIPKTIKKFDIARFDSIDLKMEGENRIPIIVHGKPQTLLLKRMDFEHIDDGIDSFSGKIEGVDNSLALFTFGGKVVQGYLESGDEILTIAPVENRASTEKATKPLHIVYSSKDVINSEKGTHVDNGPAALPPGVKLSTQPLKMNPKAQAATRGWETVSILIGTDNAFYTQESNWVSSANEIMSMADYQYDRADIQVMFNVVSYDASKRTQLSNNPSITTDPLNVFKTNFPVSYLNTNNADIALYLGGYDYKGSDAGTQGASWGFGYYPSEYCRYAWSQMVTDTDDGLPVHVYDGSLHARRYCVIHELGHIFNANHEDSSGTNKAYVWYTPTPKYTVMWSGYYGPSFNTHEYSSPSYHGDLSHNNALAINGAKSYIASII